MTQAKNFRKSKSSYYRLTKKIKDMIKENHAYFLTITFNNESLENLTETTRKNHVKQWLKDNFALYIANQDYGKKKQREHYHAIVLRTMEFFNDIKVNKYAHFFRNDTFKNGFINQKRIFTNEKYLKSDIKRLINHIYKPTNNKNNIIFSRKIPTKNEQLKRIKNYIESNQDFINDLELKERLKNEKFNEYNKEGFDCWEGINKELIQANNTNNLESIINHNKKQKLFNSEIENIAISEYIKNNNLEFIKKLDTKTLNFNAMQELKNKYGEISLRIPFYANIYYSTLLKYKLL